MRILLTHKFFTVKGGAEVFYHEVGRVLSERGDEVAYFSVREDAADTIWKKYFPLEISHSEGVLVKRVLNFHNMIYYRAAKEAMARLIDDFKPDIIHAFALYVHLTPAILDAARGAGVPVVMSCNDYKHICPNYKLYHHGRICEDCKGGKYYHAALNHCCHDSYVYSIASTIEAYVHKWMNIYRKNVHTFLFASEFMAKKTEEHWGEGAFRWDILRNPFDARKYNGSVKYGDYGVYFGRLIEEKGVDVLLQSAAIAREVPLVVIGDGPDLEKLKQQAEEQCLSNVKFVGEVWGGELDLILKDCRFVAVPSLWHENFPYVIMQSFSMSKPVIGSNRGGIPEMVAHGERGLVYEATDPVALAEAMRSLLADDKLAEEMGKAGKRYLEMQFNDELFYENLMAIYKGVLA